MEQSSLPTVEQSQRNPFFFSRKFFPFFVAQFLGAYNDNLFKNILLMLIAYKLSKLASPLTALAAAIFILPFFLFSAFAGYLADTRNRASLARLYKVTELLLMAAAGVLLVRLLSILDNPNLAVLSFWQALQMLAPLAVILFLMGAQSTFWSPVKYAWLPQMLERKNLISGNAVIEASTYCAIVVGTICGTLFSVKWTIGVLIACSVAGLIGSLFMPGAYPPRRGGASETSSVRSILRFALHTRLLRQAIFGITWFSAIGTFVLTQLFPLCSDVFGFPRIVLTYFLLVTTIGIGVGSYLCAKLITNRVRTVFLPISSLLVTVAFFGVAAIAHLHSPGRATLTIVLCTCCFLLFAGAGGLFVVPLNTLLQTVTPKGATARMIAGNNIVNAIGMVCISLTCTLLSLLGLNVAALFFVAGLASLLITGYICRVFPGEITRGFVRLILRLCFRVRVKGAEHMRHLPTRVIIIANHVSLLDGLLVGTFLPFRATFVMDKAWSEKWWVRPVRRFTDVLTVSAGSPRAVAAMIAGVKSGRRVVIFPEGRITVTGELSDIQPGAAFVAGRAGAALLPIRIDGAIRSRLSYMKGKIPLHLFPKITLTVSPCQTFPPPDGSDPDQLRDLQAKHLADIMHRFCQTTTGSDT